MKKYILTLITVLGLTSCSNDLLNPYTPGALTDEITLVSSADIIQLNNSAMNLMTSRSEYSFTSIFTDEAALGFNNGGQGRSGSDAYFLYYLDPSSGAPGAIWNSNYFALSRINRVLEKVDGITPKDANDKQILNRSKAEALILRALAHLKIMAYFSPNLKDDNALAGVLADRVILTTETPQRVNNGVFYAKIHADLDAALAILATNTAPAYAAKSWYPSANLAKGLKARAYMYKGDYGNAETWANNVITTSGIPLATSTQLGTVFQTNTAVDTPDVIFKLRRTIQQNTQDTNLHNAWVSISNSRTGSPFYEVSRSLYEFLLASPGDARTNLIVRPAGGTTGSLIDANPTASSDIRSTDILVPFKHGGAAAVTSAGGYNPDFIQMRISEMYFIVAEARASVGDFPGVAAALKQITDRRFAVPPAMLTITSAQQAWKAILDERRKELAFEAHRFIDLKRLYSVAGINQFDRSPLDYDAQYWNVPGANPSNFPFASTNKWALPIPQDELNANANIQQNPGY